MQQPGLDIETLQREVKTRWLKPKEVLNILQNQHLFMVEHRIPQKPPSGSWFLFNRRVNKYFRNDGYGWRKNKSGKTIAEAHGYLKVDNVEALNCYYAHAENNPTFQRRIYWMLEPAYEHIVLVHYRDVLEGSISVSRLNDSSTSKEKSGITDNSLASCIYHPFVEMQQPVDGAMMDNLLGAPAPSTSVNSLGSVFNEPETGLRSGSKTILDSVQFGEPFPEYSTGFMEPSLHSSVATRESSNVDHSSRLETSSEALYANNLTRKEAGALSAAGMPSSQTKKQPRKSPRPNKLQVKDHYKELKLSRIIKEVNNYINMVETKIKSRMGSIPR